MNTYEMIVIFKSTLNKDALETEITKMSANITNSGGQIDTVENIGRRELNVAFQGERHGHYVQFLFTGTSPELINKVNNLARITETLLKFQVHRLGDAQRKFKGNPLRMKNPVPVNFDDNGDDDLVSDAI